MNPPPPPHGDAQWLWLSKVQTVKGRETSANYDNI